MALALALAKLVNRALPFGWRLHHPTQLPAEAHERHAFPHQRLYAYLSPGMAIAELKDGHLLYVDPQDEQVSSHLIARGYWEEWIEKVVLGCLKPGARVIEVGANLGYFTVKMARAVGPSGRIDSYEANPRVSALLARSVEFNGYAPCVTVHRKAAADRVGRLSFYTSVVNGGAGNIGGHAGTIGADTLLIEVEGAVLDLDHPSGAVDLIRIDAEGAEPLILAGAKDIVARSPDLILCLEWDLHMMASRADPRPMLEGLQSQGFRFWVIGADSGLTPRTLEEMLALPHCDVIFSRREPAGPPR